jgi:phosphate transport system protein
LQKNTDLLLSVSELERKVNSKEVEIELECTAIIACFQPEAKDLRLILMILKMNSILEKIGNLALANTKSAEFLLDHPYSKSMIELASMAKETLSQLKNSINAFITEDVVLSKKICENDKEILGFNSKIMKRLVNEVIPDSINLENAFHLNNISKNLERIADLSTSLAEDTVFIAQGQIFKHQATG